MPPVPASVQLVSGDGWPLGMRVFRAVGTSRGALLCGHAMMTDGSYFDKPAGGGFASALAGMGFDVFVPDFRGRGLSRSDSPRHGWSFDDFALLDWPVFRSTAAREAGCREDELSVLGHSLGGLVVAADAALTGFRAHRTLFLTANMWDLTRMEGIGERARAHLFNSFVSLFVRLNQPFPSKRLSIGNCDEAPAYWKQFLEWARSGQFRSREGFDYGGAMLAWDQPVVSVVAGGDWMCTAAGARRFVRAEESGIPVVVEGPANGHAIHPNHFDLIRNPACSTFRPRVAAFLLNGRLI